MVRDWKNLGEVMNARIYLRQMCCAIKGFGSEFETGGNALWARRGAFGGTLGTCQAFMGSADTDNICTVDTCTVVELVQYG